MKTYIINSESESGIDFHLSLNDDLSLDIYFYKNEDEINISPKNTPLFLKKILGQMKNNSKKWNFIAIDKKQRFFLRGYKDRKDPLPSISFNYTDGESFLLIGCCNEEGKVLIYQEYDLKKFQQTIKNIFKRCRSKNAVDSRKNPVKNKAKNEMSYQSVLEAF